MHAFSGEFALAEGVTGALGPVGAHMTIDAFGSPWTLLSYKGPISKTSFFPYAIQYRRMQPLQEEENRHSQKKKKTRALTLHNRGARVALCVNPDRFEVIFTQHIIVPVLAF